MKNFYEAEYFTGSFGCFAEHFCNCPQINQIPLRPLREKKKGSRNERNEKIRNERYVIFVAVVA